MNRPIYSQQQAEVLRIAAQLRAEGNANPTYGEVRERQRLDAEKRSENYFRAAASAPKPIGETSAETERRLCAEWLERNVPRVDRDYDDAAAIVQRAKANTAAKNKARRDTERKKRVDAFEAGMQYGER